MQLGNPLRSAGVTQRERDPWWASSGMDYSLEEIEDVAADIASYIPPSPQLTWPMLSSRLGAQVWVKHENHSVIGAFKARGALAYLQKLKTEMPRLSGVVAASTGNFGQSIAYAAIHRHTRADHGASHPQQD